ncbi:MAG: glutamate--tRNA ligase, partial [Actinomycetota bacterium]
MAGEDNSKIRVRFAPSPTGHLHIGGARTALYNWLFARSNGGVFILRIEDTDLKRSTEENVRKITDSLEWLGLDWDEGPDRGGAHGPYRQTERLQLYTEIAETLIAEGKAYRCYCTVEEIGKARDEAKRAGKPYVYGGKCAGLKEADEEAFKREGRSPVIRLKTPPDGKTVVNDIIRGDVEFENVLTGDFILVRASGVPTYNLAAAADDALMEISHVIRGDDHLPNTPRQILILNAIGKKAPVYAHLPLILGPDRTPLSKRHGSASVEELRDAGYLSEAVINYLALLGWSYDDKTTIFSVSELIEKFSLKRIGSNAAVFDLQKLTWMNGVYIREMDTEELARRLSDYIEGTRLAGLPGKNG